MKSAKYQRRFYRDWARAKDLRQTHIVAKETDIYIYTNKALDEGFAKERIRSYRWEIENYIDRDRRFLVALKPLEVELNAPAIIREMVAQSKKAGVGPMAAVAGAVAEFLGRDLIRNGYKDAIIENGGDIYLKTTRSRRVGVYAGRSKLWNNLTLKIRPKDTPLGICTSSGALGHSLSFGSADSVSILSKSAILADAVATATANRIRSARDLKNALTFAKGVNGVLGAVIIMKNNLLSWGKIVVFNT
ncbi:MAG: UPF0280 family protein [Candidatus Omnitrophota bacterium]|nr:UPF0280 family protein [Candidatus Omnitrophota bacterium]